MSELEKKAFYPELEIDGKVRISKRKAVWLEDAQKEIDIYKKELGLAQKTMIENAKAFQDKFEEREKKYQELLSEYLSQQQKLNMLGEV